MANAVSVFMKLTTASVHYMICAILHPNLSRSMESRAVIHLCPLMKTVNEMIFYKTRAHSTTLCKEL